MDKSFRIPEYKILAYRLLLAYFFYFIARILFYYYNQDLIVVDSIASFFKLCLLGLTFDTTAILYINLLFILLSVLPLKINTFKKYQRMIFWVYFIPNFIAFATNFIDFAYYRFTFARASMASLESIKNEPNKSGLLFSFVGDYWHVFLLFALCTYLWIKLYNRFKLVKQEGYNNVKYFSFSIIAFVFVGVLIVGGIRGDFKHSTRPITLIDASRHVTVPEHANMVLNTPFSIIRTYGNNDFEKKSGIPEAIIQKAFHPIKEYHREVSEKPNIVIIILESLGREYIGSFNADMGIENYVGYTPFIDSLAQQSLIFTNGFANGRKSIHAMSSILAGIPSFKTAYTSSPYATQQTQSLISGLNEMGYDTSFFHGAPNGSMGFSGYATILGFDHYYGKTEYNNDADYDGIWGIWDEPFLGFVNDELSKKEEPFMGTIFTVTSHTPYIIPEKYEGKFPEGELDIHKCVGYTDYALRTFFKAAAKESWYKNTIFVITADHTNQIYYDEYLKMVNRFAVPILFYSSKENLVGIDKDLAMQIDIYPTLMDLAGYNKPFRSWGRSLVTDSTQTPYAIMHNGSNLMFMRDSIIGLFSKDETLGFYDINDKGLTKNLKSKQTEAMQQLKQMARGFEQDYMNRIIDGRLSAKDLTTPQ